ncbi:MAG: LacI family DNA-binding transcriptional regulator [Thermoleophilia bacterium]|nr:LacI family DNA-binding transcriptional regulator [Thermoleophilia bacterium]
MTVDRARRQPTLRDVAHRAGVSIWTASNAFSNPHRVADATRQRVLRAAVELDYSGPHPSARTLALGRSRLVALVSDVDAARQIADPAGVLVAQGLTAACDRAGLSVVLAGASCDLPVDGHVVFRGDSALARPPAVVVDAQDDAKPCVSADSATGLRDLLDHLRERGHRRVAVLTSPALRGRTAAVERLASGVVAAVHVSGDEAGWPTRQAGNTTARRILAPEDRPTAVVALDDALALGVLEALHQMGLAAPRDVSVAGVGDIPGADLAGLTTVMVPYRPMGELAGEILAARIEGRDAPAVPALPTGLVVRASAGPPPA